MIEDDGSSDSHCEVNAAPIPLAAGCLDLFTNKEKLGSTRYPGSDSGMVGYISSQLGQVGSFHAFDFQIEQII